ncbi:MATE family efflux transporter [Catenovulum adriaticum]|uniref:MATE family efflux transporter n=1 Tax=Catenovulum adriaticum TaxID=2984846 RepID=A0ABY7ANV0_9ALTE|nr:MATE family efflux transporter [Catenovulum sp. TS8]WAJ70009.1 MATE family efflux transporter [Catenovulum sp. TS8]
MFLNVLNFSSIQLRAILAIAIPMIVSNVTTPLLGLVDTAVLGHLPQPHLLAGVTISSMLITAAVWIFGFLRMSVTGLTAQASVKSDGGIQTNIILKQTLTIAGLAAILILLLQSPYLQLGLWYANTESLTQLSARDYFEIRIWAIPASLANLVLIGWLLAQHKAKQIMWVQILINLTNLVLDLILVYQFNLGVKGVAWASFIAEYLGFICLLLIARPLILPNRLIQWQQSFSWQQLKPFMLVNRDILLRTLILQSALLFITFQGARLGVNIVASNAVLMNFMMLISLGLDGIAYAAEVLVGKHYGAKKAKLLKQTLNACAFFTAVFAIFYSLLFIIFGQKIINLMTDITPIREIASDYLIYIMVLPVTAAACFLLDGVFIGLAASKTMRNSMLVSVCAVFFPVWFICDMVLSGIQAQWANHALWIALNTMMIARGITLYRKIPAYIARAESSNVTSD